MSSQTSNRHLFYPCSGRDFIKPILLCHHSIDHFWFVDPRYEGGGSSFHPFDTRTVSELIQRRLRTYTLVDISQQSLEGTTLKSKKPYVVVQNTLRFHFPEEDRLLYVHLCGGLGFNAFRSIFDNTGRNLSVFYYCGDSGGEGGSGFYWLSWRLKSVLQRLSNNGIIISDGSNARSNFQIRKEDQEALPFDYRAWSLYPKPLSELFPQRNRYKEGIGWLVQRRHSIEK